MRVPAVILALLCVTPTLLLIAGRYLAFRRHVDPQARRRYLRSALLFGGSALGLCVPLIVYRGVMALPVFCELLLPALAASLLLRLLRRA